MCWCCYSDECYLKSNAISYYFTGNLSSSSDELASNKMSLSWINNYNRVGYEYIGISQC